MEFWEAMLKGAKMKHQIFFQLYKDGGSCAVGALYDGLTWCKEQKLEVPNNLSSLFVAFIFRICPIRGCKQVPGIEFISHLNDWHKWSRENIAYYIRDNYKSSSPLTYIASPVKEKDLAPIS